MSSSESPQRGGHDVAGDHFILMYHHVGSVTALGALAPFVVSPAAFRSQLDAIEARGFKVETLSELLAADQATRSAPSIVITFDDCPAGLLDFAIPELGRRGWRATFFAVAGKVGTYNDWDVMPGVPKVPLMHWDQLRQLSASGHEIGAHGFSHTSLRRQSRASSRSELVDSRAALEQGTGAPVRAFAYPFGEIPDDYSSLCEEAGYEGACSIFSISRQVLGDRFAIRRILVTEADVGLRMRAKLSRLYLRARALIVDPRVLRRDARRAMQ
jgi:peptidoglycan/xylan/chitin deacetylase (PgdA/CDA1 family)